MKFLNKRTPKVMLALASVVGLSAFSYWYYQSIGWQMFGQNKENTAFQAHEHKIGAHNVGDLNLKWVYDTDISAAAMGAVDTNLLGENSFEKGWVKATPAVAPNGKVIYFPDMNGRLHAVDTKTGQPIWVKNIVRDYIYNAGTLPQQADIKKVKLVSQNTPVIHKDLIIIGLRPVGDPAAFFNKVIAAPNFDSMISGGATVLGINRFTGELVWRADLSEYPTSKISASMSIHKGIIYGGVSIEAEETAIHPLIDGGQSYEAITAAYQFKGIPMPNDEWECCNAIGSLFALDAETGAIKWSTPTIDDKPGLNRGFNGFAGISMWGSAPAIDPERNQVYVATSSALGAPPEILPCLEAAEQIADPSDRYDARAACIPEGVHIDSIMALDMDTGVIKWSKSYGGADFSDATCYSPLFASVDTEGRPVGFGWGKYFDEYNLGTRADALEICGDPRFVDVLSAGDWIGRDLKTFNINFGQSPTLVKSHGKDILITGQKTSDIIALDPDNGDEKWITRVGIANGAAGGGSMFGIATDGKMVYSTDGNPFGDVIQLKGETEPAAGAFFNALDVETGEIVWQTRDRNVGRPSPRGDRAFIYGHVTLANGVLYGTSVGNSLYALDAKTGEYLFEHEIDGAGYAPPAIYKGNLYWPTGYGSEPFISGSLAPEDDPDYTSTDNKVYAFELPKGNNGKNKGKKKGKK